MCGIIGAVAERDVVAVLLEGLKRLEYRGYDSAGIAVINQQAKIDKQRAVGKVSELVETLKKNPLSGKTGIAHTRWATHGKPIEKNAHPLSSSDNRIAVVHNGIIENHEALRKELTAAGYQFVSDTDTEIAAHLLHHILESQHNNRNNFMESFQQAVKRLQGAYALAVIDSQNPDKIFAVRQGSPMVVGLGIGENFFGSDTLALMPVTQRFIYLEDGDTVCIEKDKITLFDKHDKVVKREIKFSNMAHGSSEKGEFRHYMLKEIFEQPQAVSSVLEGRISRESLNDNIFGFDAENIFSKVERVQIAACGTSYHAGCVAKYWIEEIAGISCQVEVASELRYRKQTVEKNTLFVTLSQSGETADTLSAQKLAKSLGYLATLSICNVPESSLIRQADLSFLMHAGPEIGVASTKAFTSQLVCLLLLTMVLARNKSKYSAKSEMDVKETIHDLKKLPKHIEQLLNLNSQIIQLAKKFEHTQHALFIGRNTHYPIALEGALKLKEISYIHAEGYPAGELKHGPLALLDKDMPVIVLAPRDELIDKLKSNIQEIQARGAQVIIFTEKETHLESSENTQVIYLPACEKILSPILYTVPLQLLAYHVAVLKGTDVDQPRNLAKSVTVE
jgi:glucosamine--fructose-6-phosphate aminotransferase (isomerizing)